ncbi:hypothetical protein GOBAR_DD06821 [Gossypium barbadense]|nr:hypothetical protein GOBAR_DD06821 [Gossypium barbadense]
MTFNGPMEALGSEELRDHSKKDYVPTRFFDSCSHSPKEFQDKEQATTFGATIHELESMVRTRCARQLDGAFTTVSA